MADHCPRCRRRLSDWFVWPTPGHILRYCWPCYRDTREIITEDRPDGN